MMVGNVLESHCSNVLSVCEIPMLIHSVKGRSGIAMSWWWSVGGSGMKSYISTGYPRWDNQEISVAHRVRFVSTLASIVFID